MKQAGSLSYIEMRHGVRVEDREAFQWFEINLRGMGSFRFVRAVRAGNELADCTAANIGFENLVRVVKIRNDQVELGEVIHQIRLKCAATGEKARQPARLNRLHAIHQTTCHRELRDVRITEHFQVRLGKLAAQGGNGRQRENKIADCPAANDQNPGFDCAHIARNTVRPRINTNTANARRMALPMRMRSSVAVAQFKISRSFHGVTVNQMPPTTSR